jgi:hypothetical protein
MIPSSLEAKHSSTKQSMTGMASPKLNDSAPNRPTRIRCPKCAWEPKPEDRWYCLCLYVWNTFDTRGRCPGCSLQWAETQCLRCHEMSLHEDWYEGSPHSLAPS